MPNDRRRTHDAGERPPRIARPAATRARSGKNSKKRPTGPSIVSNVSRGIRTTSYEQGTTGRSSPGIVRTTCWSLKPLGIDATSTIGTCHPDPGTPSPTYRPLTTLSIFARRASRPRSQRSCSLSSRGLRSLARSERSPVPRYSRERRSLRRRRFANHPAGWD
jgi:hypothetical protein